MTNKTDHSGFFWPSYTDLMTSLFFIMLVLYILTFVKLRSQQKATEEQLKKITEIQNAVTNLPQDYFEYEAEFKRYKLVRKILFPVQKSDIPVNDEEYLEKVGRSIERMINELKVQFDKDSIKYLIVIEGMASKDGYVLNYQLSYERAKALYDFWIKRNIVFDPTVCEIVISGSGTGGVGRDLVNESNNQRILIQIIPKLNKFANNLQIASVTQILTPKDSKDNAKENPSLIRLSQPAIKKAEIEFLSYPSGSTVIANNKIIGKTPLKAKLEPGNYNFSIMHDGYTSQSWTALISEGESLVFNYMLGMIDN